jgi:hypothetical protein
MLPNLLLLLAPLAAAPATPAAPAMQSPATFPGATLGESLARVTERDGRVSFTPRSAVLAQRALERLDPQRAPLAPGSVLEWSEALFALGAGGDVSARAGLGDLAAEAGSQPQGLAAILALGALGPRLGSARQDLLDWAREDDETRRRHALLALFMADPAAGRTLASELAEADSFAAALAAHEAPALLPEDPCVRRWYALRLGAAQSFGLVDGRPWSETKTEQLSRDRAFLEEWILGELSFSMGQAERDHLLALLLEDPTPARVRAAVRLMPDTVEALVKNQLWAPRGDAGWRELALGALQGGGPRSFPAVLTACLEVPAARWLALPAVARGDVQLELDLDAAFRSDDSGVLLDVLLGSGASDRASSLQALAALASFGDPEVEAEALVVRARLGDGTAHKELVGAMEDWSAGTPTAYASYVPASLMRHRRGVFVVDLCEALVDTLTLGAPGRIACLAILRLGGRSAATSDLLAEAARAARGTPGRDLALEALGHFPSEEELQFVIAEFPPRFRGPVDVVLAGALLRAGRVEVEPLLSAALWEGSMQLSTLAAALSLEHLGSSRLMLWGLEPPAGASREDVRRVGYALGQLGGMPIVEEIARRLGTAGGTDRPLLQGALLGALGTRTHQ